MDDKQKTESIKGLVEKIDKEEIVLPEFQRNFVWDIRRSYDLFDSLVRDIFIGSIIYGIPSFEITVRSIDTRPRKGEGSRAKFNTISYTKEQISNKVQTSNFRLVLDGQQRITSLYRALKDLDSIWFIVKNEDEIDENYQDNDIKDIPLEEFLFEIDGQENNNRLSIKISDVYKLLTGEILRENRIKDLLLNSLYVQDGNISIEDEEFETYFEKYLMIFYRLRDLFLGEKLLSYYLLDMNSEKFALFFERSNSKGIQLNFVDILAAKLYKGFNLRKKIEHFEANYSNYKLDREIIVRTISLFVSDNKNLKRAYILSNLDYIHFNNYWDEVCSLYIQVLDFLYKQRFILSQSWIPYNNMLIPLMVFLKGINNDFSNMNEFQFSFIKLWYWNSIFAQRYTGQSNEAIIQDSRVLKLIASNKKVKDKSYFTRFRSSITNPQDLYTLTKKQNVLYKGVLNLLNFNDTGLKDWNNSSSISFNDELEDHHIFPKAFIDEKYSKDDDIQSKKDSVPNRTLIPKIKNRKIGKKSPSSYFTEIKEINENYEESLTSHLIPSDIDDEVYDSFFSDFLEDRANQLYDMIFKNIINEKIKNDFIASYFESPILSLSTNIKVFGSYRKQKVEATFNRETQEIFYQGQKYSSVSAAADQAKKVLTGKEIISSTNGWSFWKYEDEDGQIFQLIELRK